MNKGLVKVGGNLGGVRNRTKGHSVRPNLKPHGPRWPAQRPLHLGPPRTSERVYTPRVYYNHLLQEKQAFFFELAAKKKPLLPASCREGDIQTVLLPQPHNPKTSSPRKNWMETRTREKLHGGKRFVSQLVFLTRRSSVRHAKPLSKRRSCSQIVRWSMCPCVANLRSSTAVCSRYISGYKSPGSTVGANTCRRICSGRGGLEREKAGRESRAAETDTKESTRQTQTETKRRKFSSL